VEKQLDLFTGASTGASGAAVPMTIVVEVGADGGLAPTARGVLESGSQAVGLGRREIRT